MWRDIPGYEGYYQVSDDGRVRSVDREINNGTYRYTKKGKELSNLPDVRGYPHCALCRDNKYRYMQVHRLVALVFLGEPNGRLVHHKNHNRADPRLENLEYLEQKEHNRHHFRGEGHPNGKLSDEKVREIRRMLDQGIRHKDIAAKFGVAQVQISRIKHGKTWAHVV